MLLHNKDAANGSNLGALVECRMNDLSEKVIFLGDTEIYSISPSQWNSSGV